MAQLTDGPLARCKLHDAPFLLAIEEAVTIALPLAGVATLRRARAVVACEADPRVHEWCPILPEDI